MATKKKTKEAPAVPKKKPKTLNIIFIDKECSVTPFKASGDFGVYIDTNSPFDKSCDGWMPQDFESADRLATEFRNIAIKFQEKKAKEVEDLLNLKAEIRGQKA